MLLGFLLYFLLFLPFVAVGQKAEVVPAADGVPIHYAVQGKGETSLVFIHCWGCDRHLWDNQVATFSKTYRVVTIDLPGHGESGQQRKKWSVEEYGEDVKRVVTKLDLKRVVLVGSSMGGSVALEAARRMPERVVAIVPVDTLQNVEDKMPREQLDSIVKQLRADFKGTLTGLLNQYLFSPSTPVAVKNRVINEATSRPLESSLAILEAVMVYDQVQGLSAVKVPIRAINSDLHPTKLETNRKYAPQFEVTIIKGVGHYPMLEDPARFNAMLTDVITALRI
ncbi:MAG TPA: alpha/beta hydrolase [Pyrinomonadaceae bacterium]|nr:alpha/beta hydrolase [Pyrinomonadaceae bacterium]